MHNSYCRILFDKSVLAQILLSPRSSKITFEHDKAELKLLADLVRFSDSVTTCVR